MPAEREPVYILDLDGTILSKNSFPHWVLHLARAPFPGLRMQERLAIFATVVALVAGRKLGFVEHERFKHRLQSTWRQATEGDGGAAANAFATMLARHIRPELAPMLKDIADGRVDAVMATAAPEDYAHALGTAMGFRHVLATLGTRPMGHPGNIREHKCAAVLAFLAENGWNDRPRVLFTDHRDDLPLIAVCHQTYWFGGKSEGRAIAASFPGISLTAGFRTAIGEPSPRSI